jgi:hypothetical protein
MARLLVLLVVIASSAYADRVELAGKVSVSAFAGSQVSPAGDPRYLAVSPMLYDGNVGHVEVLDLERLSVERLEVSRATLIRRYGHYDVARKTTLPPDGELVAYEPERAGLYLSDDVLIATRRHWYVEVDPRSGKIKREVSLGFYADDEELHLIGADPVHHAAWFYLEQFGSGRDSSMHRTSGPDQLVLRRLDLATLDVTDEVKLRLPARRMKSGYEDRITVHAAADYARFAVVEYDEAGLHLAPAASVYFLDPDAKTSFAVPALETTYGVAFAPDGKYAYLASARLGTIARVDLVTKQIDKRVAGPALTHHAAVTPGGKLLVLGTSSHYTTFDLPDLGKRADKDHARGVAAAASEMHGAGHVSADGRYFVLPDARRDAHELVVAKIVE